MSNELIKANQLPITEIMSIGKAFADSGMFPDTKQAAQAIVKIQAGQEIGIPPFAAMTGIHIILGKPTIGAGIIAAKIKASGKYDYKVIEQSNEKCSIDFYQGKEKIGNSTFTIEEAKKAGTKNLDKFPKNMLFARAISNGVKWFTPDVFMGPVYTPEDFDMQEPQTQDIPHEEIVETPPTTLYNHNQIGTGKKQPLGNKALKDAVERIKAGEVELYDKLIEMCDVEAAQKSCLENAVNEFKNSQNKAA